MARQITDIFGPFTQRRQAQRDDIQAIEQVFAEKTLLDLRAQIAVGRCNDADVGADRRASADRRVFALLEHTEKTRLCFERHVADLVEEQRAAFGLLEAALRTGLRAGEGPFFVPKSSLSINSRGMAAMLIGDEGAGTALAVIVQHAGDQFLARFRFRPVIIIVSSSASGGRARGRSPAWQASGRSAVVPRRPRSRSALRLAAGAPARGRPRETTLGEIEGLGQIFVSAFLGSGERGHQRVLRAHDDDRNRDAAS